MTQQREYQEEWLTAYLDGELDEEQLRIVRKRLEDDPAAARMFEELKEVRRMIGSLQGWSGNNLKFTIDPAMAPQRPEQPKPEEPEVAPAKQVTAVPVALAQRNRPSVAWGRWMTVLATAACLLIAVGFLWTRFGDISSRYLSMNTPNRSVESDNGDFGAELQKTLPTIAPPSEPEVEALPAVAADNNASFSPTQAQSEGLATPLAAEQQTENLLIESIPTDPSRILQRDQAPLPPQPQVARSSTLRFNTESGSQASKKMENLQEANEIALSDAKSAATTADIAEVASSPTASVQSPPNLPPSPALAGAAPSQAPAGAIARNAGISASTPEEKDDTTAPGIASTAPAPAINRARQEITKAESKQNADELNMGAKLPLGTEKEIAHLSLTVDYPVEVDVIRSRAWPEVDVTRTFQQVIRYLAAGELQTVNDSTKPVAIEYSLALVTADASSPDYAAKIERRISQKQLLRIPTTKAGNVASQQNTPLSLSATILLINREQADTILAELETSRKTSTPLTPLWIVPSGNREKVTGALAPVVLVLRKP